METTAALSGEEIRDLVQFKGLIENYQDLNVQVQSAGFDLRVEEIRTFSDICSMGYLDFSNEKRRVPEAELLKKTNNGWKLEKNKYYLVRVAEIINMPNHLVAEFKPRSSLIRMGGNVTNAWIDPGYRGRIQFGITAFRDIFLEEHARIVQTVFFKTVRTKEYDGIYLNEGIKKANSE